MGTAVESIKGKDGLLKLLTYEVVRGKPIYYRGYKDVLQGKKTPEEVMGSSLLQGKIVALLTAYLVNHLLPKGYIITAGETGVKIPGGYRAVDLGVFRRENLEITDGYSPVAPLVAVEVDVKAELENIGFMEYVEEKVRDLFEAGTERVIWILTRPKVIMVFEKGKEGRILRWSDEVVVVGDVRFRLTDLLRP